jgi:hypothetical protein
MYNLIIQNARKFRFDLDSLMILLDESAQHSDFGVSVSLKIEIMLLS